MANVGDTNQNTNLVPVNAQSATDVTSLDNIQSVQTPTAEMIKDVCVLATADGNISGLAPVVISKPSSGERFSLTLEAGKQYIMDFNRDGVEDFTLENGDLLVSFDDGSSVTLLGYEAATAADAPADVAFIEHFDLKSVVSESIVEANIADNGVADKGAVETAVIDTVPSEDVLEEPVAVIRERTVDAQDEGEASVAANAPVNIFDISTVDSDAQAEALASLETAAGSDATAAQLAGIEPAAGAAAATGRGGFGFQSEFSATALSSPDDVGPIGPTELQYGVTVPTEDLFLFDEDEIAAPFNPVPGVERPAAGALDESALDNGNLVFEGVIDVDFGGDAAGDITPSGESTIGGSLKDGALSSGGIPVEIEPTDNGYQGTANGEVVFTLEIDQETGEYVYTQEQPFDHADGNDDNDVITLEFGVDVSDAGGDTTSTVIEISVADDAPVVLPQDVQSIDETGFGDDGASVTGTFEVDAGQDLGATIESNDVVNVTGSVDGDLKSGGDIVEIVKTDTGYEGTAGGDVVFTLEIDPETGEYTYNQAKPFDHDDGDNPDDVITLEFGVVITDFDGDSDTGSITINIADDAPSVGEPVIQNLDESDLTLNVDGVIDIDFGTDGVQSIETSSEPVIGGSLPVEGLSSNGVPVTIEKTDTGYQGIAGGETVFTLTINSETGAYSYTQLLPFDHADGTNPNDVITLEFGVLITDFDGDTAETQIRINVADDAVNATNDTDSVSGDEGSVDGNVLGNDDLSQDLDNTVTDITFNGETIAVVDGIATAIAGEFGNLEISADGSYTYTPFGGKDGVDQFTYTLTDGDGDTDTAVLSITVSVDDAPKVDAPDAVDVSEVDLDPSDSQNGVIEVDFGKDGPGTISGDGSFDLGGLTSGGAPITVTYNEDTQTYTGTAGGNDVFTLVINNDGTYNFELLDAVDHPEGSDVVSIDFGVLITDNDGDSTTTTITVNIADDVPVAKDDENTVADDQTFVEGNVLGNDDGGEDTPANVTDISFNGETVAVPNAGTITVDGEFGNLEISADGSYTYTPFGGKDGVDQFTYTLTDGDGDTDTAVLSITVSVDDAPKVDAPEALKTSDADLDPTDEDSGVIAVDFGNDAPGTFVATDADDVIFSGGKDGLLLSNGEPVVITIEDGVYVGTAGGETVFEFIINKTTGAYDFVQYAPLDHNGDVLNLSFDVRVTDNDGDSVVTTIDVVVNDDVPVAEDDKNTVADDQTFVEGNVLGNDDGGEDTPANVTDISFNGETVAVVEGVSTIINGAYGQLEISANGSYIYTANGGEDGVDQFTYTLTDGDGDNDTATLTIDVAVDDAPQIVQPEPLTVDETNINDSDDNVISVDFGNDGPGTIEGNGDFDLKGLTSNGQPIAVTFNADTQSYTGSVGSAVIFTLAIQSNGAYAFDLTGTVDHPDANDPNDAVEIEFGFKATDADGDVANGTIKVNVLDDAPEANDDFNGYDTNDGAATGNVIDGTNGGPDAADDLSQDNANTVTKVSFKGESIDVPTSGTSSIEGDFGTLEIAADGSYTYTLNDPSNPFAPISFDEDTEFPVLPESKPIANNDPRLGIVQGALEIEGNVEGTVDFVSEGAGYKNTLGFYTVDANGNLSTASVIIENINQSSSTENFTFDAEAGETLGFFIVADGYSVNNKYNNVDFDNGDLNFVYKFGTGEARAANITDDGNDVSLVFTNNDTNAQTVLRGPTYHTTERGEPNFLNADGTNRVISGLADEGNPNVLRIGFEDLPELGDEDYNDVIFDITLQSDCVVDEFDYTLTDGDGDTSDAILKMTGKDLTDDIPKIQKVDDLSVTESDGIDSDSNIIDVDFGADAPGIVTGNGLFDLKGLTSGGQPIQVVYNNGTQTYTGSAAGAIIFTLVIQQNGAYAFELNGSVDHPDANDPNDVVDIEFGFRATDADGDKTAGTIKINVFDDAPVANDDTESFDAVDGSYADDVMANDDLSADLENTLTKVSFGAESVDVPNEGVANIDGDFGRLEISADGSYEYVLFTKSGDIQCDPKTFQATQADAEGIQESLTKDGITISVANEGEFDITWVSTSDGDGFGIDNLNSGDSTKVFPNGEAFDLSFGGNVSTVSMIIGEIGNNNDDGNHGIDYVVTLADGSSVAGEQQFVPTEIKNGYFSFDLNASDYGQLITSVVIESTNDGEYRGASFLLNTVSAECPKVILEDTTDSFTYTIQDGDGDTSTATLEISSDAPDALAAASSAPAFDQVLFNTGAAELSLFTSIADQADHGSEQALTSYTEATGFNLLVEDHGYVQDNIDEFVIDTAAVSGADTVHSDHAISGAIYPLSGVSVSDFALDDLDTAHSAIA